MEQFEHINRIELQGYIGTVRTNEYNGSKVVNFTMITEHLYKTREGSAVNEQTWHNIVAWAGKDMPDLDSLNKGTPLYVTGRVRTNKYTSADGTEKFFYEILAHKIKKIEDIKE